MTFEKWWDNLVSRTAMSPFGQGNIKDIAKQAWESGKKDVIDNDPIIKTIREDSTYEKY